ncbi:MAG: DUF2177 family protein [Anaerolineales bacterium]|nr:DUF2177 family protein [Anaerolineales bacterium]MCB9171327.1 DUF2177 family protein [Ardenticatenales bacterium]
MTTYHLKLYFAALLIFLAIDALWLGLLSGSFYRRQIGHLMAPQANLVAAVAVYALLVAGLLYFAVLPSLNHDLPLTHVMLRAAFFGVVAYGTYDLTNHATLSDWPLTMTLVDMLWGGLLCALTGGAAYGVAQWLG